MITYDFKIKVFGLLDKISSSKKKMKRWCSFYGEKNNFLEDWFPENLL